MMEREPPATALFTCSLFALSFLVVVSIVGTLAYLMLRAFV